MSVGIVPDRFHTSMSANGTQARLSRASPGSPPASDTSHMVPRGPRYQRRRSVTLMNMNRRMVRVHGHGLAARASRWYAGHNAGAGLTPGYYDGQSGGPYITAALSRKAAGGR